MLALEISIVILLVVLLLLVIKTNNNNKHEENEKIEELNQKIQEYIVQLNDNVVKQITYKNMETSNLLKNTTDTLDKRISNERTEQLSILKNTINSLEEKLKVQSNTTNESVKEIVSRVSSLEYIKGQMTNLNDNITQLENTLSDKKMRGTFGEIQLLQIFEAIFGENNSKIYEEQFLLSNGKRVDLILHYPYPIGDLAIDSKFPLENYLKIVNCSDEVLLKGYKKDFLQDMKKHINDISQKYIIQGETANQAMMFIPAEAIFAYINAYEEEIIKYAYANNVSIVSPTTLMAILNALQVALKDIKRNESYSEMHEEIMKLKQEFDRFETRWANLSKHIDMLVKDNADISVTTKKIVKKFNDIENVNIK